MKLLEIGKSLSVMILICLTCELSYAQRIGRARNTTSTISSFRSGVLFDLGIYYGQSEATAEPAAGNEWSQNTSVYDVKLGYITSSQFYIGAEYSVRQESSDLNLSASGGRASAFGVGYFWDSGIHLRSFYHRDETWGDYKDGTGYQVDLGYMVNITSSFYLGLLFSHRQTTFTSNSAIANFQEWKRKETFPMLTFGFIIN